MGTFKVWRRLRAPPKNPTGGHIKKPPRPPRIAPLVSIRFPRAPQESQQEPLQTMFIFCVFFSDSWGARGICNAISGRILGERGGFLVLSLVEFALRRRSQRLPSHKIGAAAHFRAARPAAYSAAIVSAVARSYKGKILEAFSTPGQFSGRPHCSV